MSGPNADGWTRLGELAADLHDALQLAGPERLKLARVAVREARATLEGTTGCEAEAVRTLLCALGEAHVEMSG